MTGSPAGPALICMSEITPWSSVCTGWNPRSCWRAEGGGPHAGALHAGSPGADSLLGQRERHHTRVRLAPFQCASAAQPRARWTCVEGLRRLLLTRRCARLRTLVLVLEACASGHTFFYPEPASHTIKGLIARLPALASGAPALHALQLVLPIDAAEGDLRPLWRALEALPNLASLALGCATPRDEQAFEDAGERIANVLDAARVRIAGLLSWQAPCAGAHNITGVQAFSQASLPLGGLSGDPGHCSMCACAWLKTLGRNVAVTLNAGLQARLPSVTDLCVHAGFVPWSCMTNGCIRCATYVLTGAGHANRLHACAC